MVVTRNRNLEVHQGSVSVPMSLTKSGDCVMGEWVPVSDEDDKLSQSTTPLMEEPSWGDDDDVSMVDDIQILAQDEADWRLSFDCAIEAADEIELIKEIDDSAHGAEDDEFMYPFGLMSGVGDGQESSLSLAERFEASARKLTESMRKSQESRMSLKIGSLDKFPRRDSIQGVVKSVEESSEQLQSCLDVDFEC